MPFDRGAVTPFWGVKNYKEYWNSLGVTERLYNYSFFWRHENEREFHYASKSIKGVLESPEEYCYTVNVTFSWFCNSSMGSKTPKWGVCSQNTPYIRVSLVTAKEFSRTSVIIRCIQWFCHSLKLKMLINRVLPDIIL